MPQTQGAVLGPRYNDGKLRVVASERNVVCVAFQRGNKGLCGVIPDLDGPVVRGCQKIWLVGMGIVVDVVDTLGLVGLESEVGMGGSEVPDLDGPVQACGGKGIGVLGVDGQTHDVVAVALKDLDALPAALPIPKLDSHVIGGGKDKRLRRVNDNGSDIVGMRLERRNLFRGVVVVDTELKVVGAADNPVLARNEATGTDRKVGQFERLNRALGLVGPDLGVAWRCRLVGSPFARDSAGDVACAGGITL